jgi:hypothetical protein
MENLFLTAKNRWQVLIEKHEGIDFTNKHFKKLKAHNYDF